MYGLNVVRMIVPPASFHSSRVDVILHNIVVVGELVLAKSTYAVLLHNFRLQQLSHFSWRAQFPIASVMVWVIHTFYTQPQITWPGQWLAPAAKQRLMNGTAFVAAKSHTDIPP